MSILVVNSGSSSLKLAIWSKAGEIASAVASEIGGRARLVVAGAAVDLPLPDHEAALAAALDRLAAQGLGLGGLAAAAHRVVHGGAGLRQAARLTPEVEAQIEGCVPLAPLHNPPALAAIRALRRLAPELPQYASFDTAFHATNPEVALRYALPAAEEARGIRRYGFHGLSYASLVARWAEVTGGPLPRRVLAAHLGNGASLCAILEGQSVATTMGYSPLDGLTMGTRSGAIDGNAVLRLAQLHGIDGAARILNRESGLKGLGGASDMRALRGAGTPEARFAVAHFGYWLLRHAGSMVAALGGLDAIVFTGGIGENDAGLRAGLCEALGFLGVALNARANAEGLPALHETYSNVAIWIVPAAEERQIAEDAMRVMAKEAAA